MTASCINCEFQIQCHYIKQHLFQYSIPLCPYCHPIKSDLKHLLNNNNNLRKSQPILELFDAENYKLRIRIPNIFAKKLSLLSELCPTLFAHKDEILKINIYESDCDKSKTDKDQCYTLEIISMSKNYNLLFKCMEELLFGLKNCKSFGVMKPDIIFFEQDVSTLYDEMIEKHLKECDLLIVIGTSLQVLPISMIPSKLNENIPVILINREIPEQVIVDEFDVNLLGNSDDICLTLINKLKWKCIKPKQKQIKNCINGVIDIEMMDAKASKYEFIKPNICLFANGKLPEKNEHKNEHKNDNENDLTNICCNVCNEVMEVSKLIFCNNVNVNCNNCFCADCLWTMVDGNPAINISNWFCPDCSHLDNTNNSNNKKRKFEEVELCININTNSCNSMKRQRIS
eukprot:441435_1